MTRTPDMGDTPAPDTGDDHPITWHLYSIDDE